MYFPKLYPRLYNVKKIIQNLVYPLTTYSNYKNSHKIKSINLT